MRVSQYVNTIQTYVARDRTYSKDTSGHFWSHKPRIEKRSLSPSTLEDHLFCLCQNDKDNNKKQKQKQKQKTTLKQEDPKWDTERVTELRERGTTKKMVKENNGNFSSSKGKWFLGIAALAFCWMVFASPASWNSGEPAGLRPPPPPSGGKKVLEGGYSQAAAISGKIFVGTPFRKYEGKPMFGSDGWEKKVGKRSLTWEMITKSRAYKTALNDYYLDSKAMEISCKKWNVVTTIFPPTEAIVLAADMEDWCTVVVGDNKTDKDWREQEQTLKTNPRVFFFSIDEQNLWLKLPGELGEFAKLTPYNHFARKNLGFLYAILRGAEFVFDFDDDNFINKGSDGKALKVLPSEEYVTDVRYLDVKTKAFNHHPIMGATIDTSWARGFPLELIQDETTHGTVKSSNNKMSMDKVGVIQFCADNNPDIDAVHRLTKPLPMNYLPEGQSTPIAVPFGSYAPYNAQATIHTGPALFATFLPVTVKGRVTDIWRGFFAQALFRDIDLSLLFAPPRITQYRNVHNYLGDMESEGDVYFKSNKLIDFLSNWTSKHTSLPARTEELWIALYERGYIEETDVRLVQLWLASLVQMGYKFKTPKA